MRCRNGVLTHPWRVVELSTGVIRGKVRVRLRMEEIKVGIRGIKREEGMRVQEERGGIGIGDTNGIAKGEFTKSVGRIRM